ncbi:MAG: hemolysin, partial [Clostridiales bacterium]|nr:hemolysin [Clostridiales bacterium]
IKKLDSNTYLVNGLLPIGELNEHLHLSLESENTDTIGGFIINLMGAIPTSNDCPAIKYENLTFKIEEVNEKRIEKLRLSIDPEA